MLYEAYQAQRDAFAPIRMLAQTVQGVLNQPWPIVAHHPMMRAAAAACEMVARAGMWHERPPFGIKSVAIGSRVLPVYEEVASCHPFCTLRHFRKEGIAAVQPRVLVVAPLSGHFATLLRGTIETLLPDFDVYVTDWINARNVPMLYGQFTLDDHIALMLSYLRELGSDLHVIAVCQPAVPVLAAVALLAADGDRAQPSSMTLMGGPIDTRVNPTQVNQLAAGRSIEWFEHAVITPVPATYPGFMTMNLDRHVTAHVDLFNHLVRGDGESAAATRKFYDEYMSVMDLPADYYLQTVQRVFQDHALPMGTFEWRGQRVEPAAIARTALLTVEGENDDICAVGQTVAAHALLTGLAADKKQAYMQPQVGHFGVFNGRRWRTEIYPRVRAFIRDNR